MPIQSHELPVLPTVAALTGLPVREIRCGPTSSQSVGVEAAKMLVREFGLSCSVSESAAPMRY